MPLRRQWGYLHLRTGIRLVWVHLHREGTMGVITRTGYRSKCLRVRLQYGRRARLLAFRPPPVGSELKRLLLRRFRSVLKQFNNPLAIGVMPWSC